MRKASSLRYIEEVLDILIVIRGPQYIYLPITHAEWEEVSQGFERV